MLTGQQEVSDMQFAPQKPKKATLKLCLKSVLDGCEEDETDRQLHGPLAKAAHMHTGITERISV